MAGLQKPRHGMPETKCYFLSFRVQKRGFHLAHSEVNLLFRCGSVCGFHNEVSGFLELKVMTVTAGMSR